MNRRQFLQRLGVGAGSALAMMAMEPLSVLAQSDKKAKTAQNTMTYQEAR